MGIFNDKRSDKVIDAGVRALEGGAYFFTPKLEWPTGVAANAFNVEEWSRIIHELESRGWAMAQWQVSHDGKEYAAFPVFRRR